MKKRLASTPAYVSRLSHGLLVRARRVVRRVSSGGLRTRRPRRIDLLADIKRVLPQLAMEVIFDVGANVGQSAKEILSAFPDARIHCFEPATETLRTLEKNLAGRKGVRFYHLALGATPATGHLRLVGSSAMFSLIKEQQGSSSEEARQEIVQIETLDRVCRKHDVSHINFLKIDTEGGDLDVLLGAQHMLDEQRIDLVQVEAGMNPRNTAHVSLEKLKAFLEAKQFYLFGIYNQAQEWPSGEVHLRRANCVFISSRLIGHAQRPT